ncbi:testis-expressed protein 11 [Ascaphus truei]|uniref:testis-expressed protein 11 n=1 Tax=Ascaphus truei TaxID=8439 RepID=UPI003F59D6A1
MLCQEAKVLRLLATVYLEWDCRLYQDKAVSAISMANEENLHPAGLFLKIRILLCGALPDDVITAAVTEMLRCELPLELYLNTVKLLLEHGRDHLGFDFLKMVCQHFESSPELGKVLILQIQLLLQRGKELLARQKIEDLITGHYPRKQLSPDTVTQLHLILWDSAAKSFEAKNYTDALQWYDYSRELYTPEHTAPNLAKLQRNRASCLLHLKQLPKAREAVMEAEHCDPDSMLTQLSLYKIAMLESNVPEATDAVCTMGKLAAEPDTVRLLMEQSCSATDLLSLAAQIALENSQKQVAMRALEFLVWRSPDSGQVFTSLRCLVRLILSGEDAETEERRVADKELLLSYLNTAYKKLAEPLSEGAPNPDTRTCEANWFRKIAWNVAVQSETSPEVMRDCFLLSYKLSLFCPCDKPILVAQKSCLLMAAAVDLEMARKVMDLEEQVKLLKLSLQHIQLCREIWGVLQSKRDFSQDPTEIILLLYEFEVRAKLNDPGVEAVLGSVWELPNLDIKTLETIAYVSMEAPAYYPSVRKRALQSALSLHRKHNPMDVPRFSKCLHSLVKLSLPEGAVGLDSGNQEVVWGYYQEALPIIASSDYPEMETLWLMTRAWNTGIFLYNVRKYMDAERWCALAMRLLNYLGSLKCSYENQMTGLYSEILDRLDRANKGLPKEE